jgi:hypothetical protein
MPVGHTGLVQGMQTFTPEFRMGFFTQFTKLLSLFKLKLGVDNGDVRLRHTKEGLCGRSDLA